MASNPVVTTSYAVLEHAQDVKVSSDAVRSFAESLASAREPSSASDWADEPLHPVPSQHDVTELVDWIFMVSGLLNFSFWSELEQEDRFAITWHDGVDGKGKGKETDHTGYWSLPAATNRALEEGIPVCSPWYWLKASEDDWRFVFEPSHASKEQIPLLDERIKLLREAGEKLVQQWKGSFYYFLQDLGPHYDALEIVQKVVETFPAFRDEAAHPQVGKVHLWKRAQILVAELWAAFSSCPARYPQISNISALTMFADYRVPQILHYIGLLQYSPKLLDVLSSKTLIPSGSELELEIRCGSIVAVEEVLRVLAEIKQSRGQTAPINAVLLDFWLWNRAKELEKEKKSKVECHRTRSIWY